MPATKKTSAVLLSGPTAQRLGMAIHGEFTRDAELFEDGACPEFALALQHCLPGSSLMVCSRSWEEFGEASINQLSHVVVESGFFAFDAGGSDAIRRWEEKWEGDYSEKPDESVSFDWQPVTEGELEVLVATHRDSAPKLDRRLVASLQNRLSKVLKSSCPSLRPLPSPAHHNIPRHPLAVEK